ncbi:MAG TPA: hypothetical protein VN915_11155 [Elusimicrobiota bacterium]|nr:hypothetical protein [Elusimicrobiota bacterium]
MTLPSIALGLLALLSPAVAAQVPADAPAYAGEAVWGGSGPAADSAPAPGEDPESYLAPAPIAQLEAVREDFALILRAAGLPADALSLERLERSDPAAGDTVELVCRPGGVTVRVRAVDREWASAAYYGLEKLGFLFPHPRRQISPSPSELAQRCGPTYEWRARLKDRGFHLHTEHPSEWAAGFLGGTGTIAEDTVRWLARNRQNVLEVVGLRTHSLEPLKAPFSLAQRLGIRTGLSVSLSSTQQKSLRLFDAPLGVSSLAAWLEPDHFCRRAANAASRIQKELNADFIGMDLGSSEFTPLPRKATLECMNAVQEKLNGQGADLFVKVHVSMGQKDPQTGNYNFLPALANPRVGVLPHTVMFYGLDDKNAPVYGRTDLKDMKLFMTAQARKRPTWFFPENSYFVGIDIDLPLLLTNYLKTRSEDVDALERSGVSGQLVFSTGQELGYWLMDWTAALLTSAESRGNPLAGLDLLGEDHALWTRILDYQNRYIKDAGLLPMLSSANGMDELPFIKSVHRVLARRTIKELRRDPAALADERARLEEAAAHIPDVSGVKDEELRLMLEVTFGRIRHALWLRRALQAPKGSAERTADLDAAKAERLAALAEMKTVAEKYSRYPEARLTARERNLTSYHYGYMWPAANLHFWEREERMIREGRSSPFFMNIYNYLSILF